MAEYNKPERWFDASKKLFPHQVGLTAPPHDFDAAPTDLLRIAPETVGTLSPELQALTGREVHGSLGIFDPRVIPVADG